MGTRWFTGTALLAAATLLAACSHYGAYPPSRPPAGVAAASGGTYTVRAGDTLYSIAWQHGQDYRTVAAWNGIRPPYTIYPGQRLRLRAPAGQVETARQPASNQPASNQPASNQPAPSPPARSPQPPRQSTPAPAAPVSTRAAPQAREGLPQWRWPTQGSVISTFSASRAGKKGIALSGELGQPVYAAAGGRVVYSGSGLLGYGRLIIIKHDDNFLSAYGHNHRLLVAENDDVTAGQHIADMGNSGTDRVMLHFEIRRSGEPLDPLTVLPPN